MHFFPWGWGSLCNDVNNLWHTGNSKEKMMDLALEHFNQISWNSPEGFFNVRHHTWEDYNSDRRFIVVGFIQFDKILGLLS